MFNFIAITSVIALLVLGGPSLYENVTDAYIAGSHDRTAAYINNMNQSRVDACVRTNVEWAQGFCDGDIECTKMAITNKCS